MKVRDICTLMFIQVLIGCSSGGTGGTGVTEPPPGPVTVVIGGQVNKGPMAAGASVTISELNTSGTVLSTIRSTTAAKGLYESEVEKDTINLIRVEGNYYSESFGTFSNEAISLAAVHSSALSRTAHVNVLTHLIHKRVLKLMGDSSSVSAALTQAEDELIAALSNLLNPPSGSFHFSDLVVINSFAEQPVEIGNSYLLALTSILEQYAISTAEVQGRSSTARLTELIESITTDLADDGALSLDIAGLKQAQRRINPNRIHQNLFEFDASFRSQVITNLGGPSDLQCRVNLDSFECFDADETNLISANAVGTVPLNSIVADMNDFVDSDLDGIVNTSDPDDDADGFLDLVDFQPFQRNVLVAGYANKGPLQEGAVVTAEALDASGAVISSVTASTGFGGRYEATPEEGSINLFSVVGRYYSELTGEFTDEPITIRAVHDTGSGQPAHINLMTHLIHERVLGLMAAGKTVTQALGQAENELTASLDQLLSTPAGAPRFTDLVVLNTFSDNPIESGNAYLLALGSILEQQAATLSADNGLSVTANLTNLLGEMTTDLADNGVLNLDLVSLRSAERSLDPNRIHQNLFEFDSSFKDRLVNSISALPSVDPADLDCRANHERLECFDSQERNLTRTNVLGAAPLNTIVPDMGLFIDTDLDGLVNRQDEDDDSDGIFDSIDTDPFAPDLLVAAKESTAFEVYLKHGLKQWYAGDADSPSLALRQSPFGLTAIPGSPVTSDPPPIDFSPAPAFGDDFTRTNLLVAGVDEIDPVKYDGENIFVANGDTVQVLRTPSSVLASEILGHYSLSTSDPGDSPIRGIYLSEPESRGKTLSIVAENFRNQWQDPWFEPSLFVGAKTRLHILDVNDVTNLVATDQYEIDGSYVNSRRIGNTLYIVTRYTPDVPGLINGATRAEDLEHNRQLIESTDINNLLPRVVYNLGDPSRLFTAGGCLVPPLYTDSNDVFFPTITTITRIDLNTPGSMTSTCLNDGIQGLHVSTDAIYLAAFDRGVSSSRFGYPDNSLIHKFSITGGAPEYRGSSRVPGTFWGNPAFLMGEYQGRLTAITTTRNGSSNSAIARSFDHVLTILGESEAAVPELLILGQIPNAGRPAPIGKSNEQLLTSRIVGERAYVVTFGSDDPVYAIDIGDPTDPLIAGELEIPGFSTYLHPIGDNLLIGVGKNRIGTQIGTTFFQGINVRLFDVTDPRNMSVTADLSIGERGTETPVAFDPHSFTISSDENSGTHRIAIPVTVHGEFSNVLAVNEPRRSTHWRHDALYLFEANEANKTLESRGRLISEDYATGQRLAAACCDWNDRSFLNGDLIHYLQKNNLVTASWPLPATSARTVIPTLFPRDPSSCIAGLRNGLLASAYDQVTGDLLRCAEIKATRGSQTTVLQAGCDARIPGFIRRLFERPGTYQVSVTHDGYVPWQVDDVIIQTDGCHVQETNVNAYLAPGGGVD